MNAIAALPSTTAPTYSLDVLQAVATGEKIVLGGVEKEVKRIAYNLNAVQNNFVIDTSGLTINRVVGVSGTLTTYNGDMMMVDTVERLVQLAVNNMQEKIYVNILTKDIQYDVIMFIDFI